MANWKILNKKFNDVIENMSKQDWIDWKEKCDKRRLDRQNPSKEKERVSILNKLSFISKVMDSCVDVEQLDNTLNWSKTVIKNYILFKQDWFDASTAMKMYQSHAKAIKLVETKYKIKLKEIQDEKS